MANITFFYVFVLLTSIPSETFILSYSNIYTLVRQFIKTFFNRVSIKINTYTASTHNHYECYD